MGSVETRAFCEVTGQGLLGFSQRSAGCGFLAGLLLCLSLAFEQIIEFFLDLAFDLSLEFRQEVVSCTKFAALGVACRVGNTQDKGFKLFDVVGLADDVETEVSPLASVSVVEVVLDPVSEVGGEANVIERVLSIQGVDALMALNHLRDLFPELVEDAGINTFKIAGDNRPCPAFYFFLFGHEQSLNRDSEILLLTALTSFMSYI